MEENNYGISLKQIFIPVLKRWWAVLATAIVVTALLITYTYLFVEPTYTSSAVLGIKNYEAQFTTDASFGQYIAVECVEVLKSDVTLDRAAEALNEYSFPENNGEAYRVYSAKVLKGMIATETTEGSRYFSVVVTSTSPEEAKIVCEYIAQAFKDAVKEENIFNGAEGIMIGFPKLPTAPSSPNYVTTAITGILLGIVLSVGVILVIAIFKDAIDGEDRLIDDYKNKIPLLAVIPDANSRSGGYKKYSGKYGYGYGEQENT